MNRNKVKIVCNENINSISYYFQNERSKWIRVSNSSELSRKEYIFTTIREKATDILGIINEIYNPGNRGVDIFFEGSDDDFSILCNAIKRDFSEDNITCKQKKMKIAVAGKIGSGKTTLITELEKFLNVHYEKCMNKEYVIYSDKKGNSEWYDLNGIDLGIENIEQTKDVIDKFAKNGLTTVVYCFSTSKIDELEEKLILYIRETYPEIEILIALTSCIYDEGLLFAEQLSTNLMQTKVIPILAKELKTREGIIPAFGLDQIVRYIFEGR